MTGNILRLEGHDVTVRNREFANGYANLLDLAFLTSFNLVIYAERGEMGRGSRLPESVAMNLETYIQLGGNLLVTGFNTLGNPNDATLANLVRSSTFRDQASRNPDWQTTAIDNFILNGPYGDFRDLTFTATGYNDDFLLPDTARGAITLANTPGESARIIFTDLPGAGGSVGYWNGGLGGQMSNAQPDFRSGGIPQGIFLNWASVSPIPEPTAALYAVACLAVFGGSRRARRSS